MEKKNCDHIDGFYYSICTTGKDRILRKSEVREDIESGIYFQLQYKFTFCPDCGEKINETI